MRRTLLVVLGTAVLAVTGCSDDEESATQPVSKQPAATQPAAALTKREYTAKADDICRDIDEASKPYEDRGETVTVGSDVEEYVPSAEGQHVELRQGVARLRALPRPSANAAILDAYLETLAKRVSLGERYLVLAKANENLKARELIDKQSQLLYDEQKRLAKRYGFKYCTGY